jgi:hypothetical protein
MQRFRRSRIFFSAASFSRKNSRLPFSARQPDCPERGPSGVPAAHITYRLGGVMSTGPVSFVYFMMNDSFLL